MIAKAATGTDFKNIRRQNEARRQRRRKILMFGIPAGLCVIVMLVWYSMQPRKMPVEFGICKTFIELNVLYPQSIWYLGVEFFQNEYRIYHSYQGSFGERYLKMIACAFKNDPVQGLVIDKVKIDGVKVDAAKVAAFNLSLPAIIKHDPSFTVPRTIGADLIDLKVD